MSTSSPSADRGRTRPVAAVAAAVYALSLVLAWIGGGVWRDRKSETMLRKARDEFSEYLGETLHAVQWYQASLAFDALGSWSNAAPHTVSEMRAVADRLYIDELNVVSSNGVVIASNIPKVVGDDWHRDPRTAAFLELLSPTSNLARMAQPRMSQPFRRGTVNPEYYCTYFAESFLDRSGILELGYAMERLVAVLAYSDCKNVREWTFGRFGHFTAVDTNGDRTPDPIPPEADEEALSRGVLDRTDEDGESAYRLTFAYAGRLFAAVLPAREFGGQRLYVFLVFAATSALLILLFAAVLVRLAHVRRRVEALRRAAEERAAGDLAVARKIQLSTLPRTATFAPEHLAFSLAAVTQPAREVGGDYYDFFRAADGRLALVIADVSGKGVPAALFMHEAKHAFPEALRAEGALAAAVARMNGWLFEHNEAEMFVTAWFGLLDPATGALECVNAGHNRPYLLPSAGEPVRFAERGGLFLGMFPEAAYRATRRQLAPGDRLVLFTDGVTEAMDAAKRPFGEERFAALLAAHPDDPVAATVSAVAAHAAGAEPSDDLTMLVATWHGPAASARRTFRVGDATAGDCVAFLQSEVALADRRQKARLVNAADELVANVVAYSGASSLTVEVASGGGRCRVVLADDGAAYNPLAHRDPDTHLALEDRPEGGLGILMVKRLVDFCAYRREGDRNVLTLVCGGASGRRDVGEGGR